MQDVIVYIIGGIVAVYIVISVYRFISRRSDPCRGCSGCDVKTLYDAKRMTCGKKDKGCGCGK